MLYIFNNLEVPVSVVEVVLDLRRRPRRQHPVVVRAQRGRLRADHADPRASCTTSCRKQAGRPIYSHRLSILHFWSLIFIYIWAGPHHLIYSPLPDWAQSLGTAFSIMLILPSWGGMLNGLLTLRGAWDKVRTDPILKMFVVGLTFYGMSTFEGPMMALKTVNALSHFTNWTIGHVHSGALGWVALTCFATLYYMIPRLWHTQLYSLRLAEAHFWVATLGHRAVRDADVDLGRDAGPDVARGESRREPRLHLRRVRGGDPHLRRDPRRRRRAVPLRSVR